MAQTGYTPILIYSSTTAAQAPAVGNLTNSTLGSELAINITDGKLFYKDNANAIQVIAWKTTPTTAGGTGLTSYTAGDMLYYASGTTLTKLAIGTAYQALQVNAGGTAPSWQPSSTSVLTAQGDLLYASAANTLARLAKSTTATRYLANTGTNNNPAWAQIDLTNGVTGTLPVGNGGTGLTAVSAGYIPFGNSATALTTSGDLTFLSNNLEIYSSITARNGSGNAVFRYRTASTDMQWTGISASNNVSLIDNATGFTLLNISGTTYDLTVNRGNVVPGTAAKGINFTANTPLAGMTSQLLNYYEEGTWTPTYTGWSSNPTLVTANYTRIGRMVHLNCIFFGGTTAGGATIGSLPYQAGYQGAAVAAFTAANPSIQITGVIMDFATSITNINAITVGGVYWTLSVSYFPG
jgi:hypothetical protein